MSIRAEYKVKKLGDDFVTQEVHYAFEQDGDRKDKNGNLRLKMVPKLIESRGGWIFEFPGKPGHSIRLTSLDQMKQFGIRDTPRLIDDQTGEEVSASGVPLDIAHLVNEASGVEIAPSDDAPGGGVEATLLSLEDK